MSDNYNKKNNIIILKEFKKSKNKIHFTNK